MNAPLFYNRNGTLTRYAFGCGYVEKYGDAGTLWLEGGVYHVRGWYGETRVWETRERVGEARAFARATFGAYRPAVDAFSGI